MFNAHPGVSFHDVVIDLSAQRTIRSTVDMEDKERRYDQAIWICDVSWWYDPRQLERGLLEL